MAHEELHTERLNCGLRTYFFDIKKNDIGRLYLKITCSQKTDAGFAHYKLSISDQDMLEFAYVFKRSVARFDQLKQRKVAKKEK